MLNKLSDGLISPNSSAGPVRDIVKNIGVIINRSEYKKYILVNVE